jgi:Uma2 family endonuclease
MAVDVERRLFTIDEYVRMAEAGIFADHERVELIEGEVIEMSPIGTRHAAFVANLTHLLVHAVGERARVWVQGPLRVPPRSLPQPDLALLRMRSYVREPATMSDALLVIEVADRSLPYDRTTKLRLYARANIPEYWLVDVRTEAVDIHRAPSGETYAEHRRAVAGDHVAPAALPDAGIQVGAIFL